MPTLPPAGSGAGVVPASAYSTAGDVFSLVRSMLRDADIPMVLGIAPVAGATRIGNVVTITTTAPHNLQIGMMVDVEGVTDSGYDGVQTVSSIPSATTFTYNQFDFDGVSQNGTVSIVIQGDWATDAVQLPLANKAYRKVQAALQEAGSRTTTNDVILTPAMPIDMQVLDDSSSPQLPVDFLAPREIYERVAGQQFFGRPMTPVDKLPNSPQTTLNGCYAYFSDSINFLGATGEVELRMRYFASYPNLGDARSRLLIRGSVDPVASYTAYLLANSISPASAVVFLGMFKEDMAQLLNMQAHSRQYKPGRRRPNNSRRGYRGGWATV